MVSIVAIRPAVAADADAIHAAIVRLGTTLGQADKIASTADDLRRFGFGGEPAFHGLIAEIDGQFAGVALFFPIFSTWLGRPGVFVQDLHVDEAFRGHGIGESLIGAVARWSHTRGGVYLRLSVDATNIRAQKFYQRIGISHRAGEREHGAYGDAFQALVRATDQQRP